MNTHNACQCAGCDQVLHLDELALWFNESTSTLYKWAAAGYPAFPRRLNLRNKRIAVTCNSVKSWLKESAA
jgi:predicted DNA-binding transcriptional regulator AlpA